MSIIFFIPLGAVILKKYFTSSSHEDMRTLWFGAISEMNNEVIVFQMSQLLQSKLRR